MTASVIGALPIWWLLGHQLSNPAVNTSKACSTRVFTTMLLRTDASITLVISFSFRSVGFIGGPRFGGALERRQGAIPEAIEIRAERLDPRGIQLVEAAVAVGPIE